MEQRKALWQSTAFCSWCAVRMRRQMPWLSHSLGALMTFMSVGMLQGIDPFDGSTSWLQRGLGAVALAAAISLLWLGAARLNGWQPLRSSSTALPRRQRVLAVLLVAAALLVALCGLMFRRYNDGRSLPFSSPATLGGIADIARNHALRGRFVAKGKGPGFVRGVVVDVNLPQGGPVTTIVHTDGASTTFWAQELVFVPADRSESSLLIGRQLCEEASRLRQHFRSYRGTLRPGFPHPGPGQVRFYVNTDDDLLVAEAALADLASPTHPLSSLWKAAEHARRAR